MFLHMIPIPRHARFCLKWKNWPKVFPRSQAIMGFMKRQSAWDVERQKCHWQSWTKTGIRQKVTNGRDDLMKQQLGSNDDNVWELKKGLYLFGGVSEGTKGSSLLPAHVQLPGQQLRLPSGRRWWSALFFVSRRSPAIRTGYFNAYLIPLFKMTNFSPAVPDFWALALYAHNFSFFSWL